MVVASRRVLSRLMSGAPTRRKTAGIIVIGDEILSGSTHDTNSSFLCQRLHNKGVAVKKISVVGDSVSDIAQDVADFSQKYDIVLTTGGVGPTHDDVTYEGTAFAFNDHLKLNTDLKEVFEGYLSKYKRRPDAEEALTKFCSIPSTGILLWGDEGRGARRFPCVQVKNVVLLPGVPNFCQQGFEQLENTLFPSQELTPFYSKALYLGKNEIHLQHDLRKIAHTHLDKGVSIGSYPVIGNSYYKTKVSVEATTMEAGELAFKELSETFAGFLRNFDELPWLDTVRKYADFRAKVPDEVGKLLDESMSFIEEILRKFGVKGVALSFNGGKDCTVLLHLLRVKMDELYGPETKIPAFHIICDDDFPELRKFLLDISWKYNVELRELGGNIKQGLETLSKEDPRVKAVFMGSRLSDPHGKYLTERCQKTDADWPEFYRVLPILDWSYSMVWFFLRGLCVPYCSLYDRGYTSLGNRSSTKPNPALRIDGAVDQYKPAYCLFENHLERQGRDEVATG